MDCESLRQGVEEIIKGLECMQDLEATQKFRDILDNFSKRMFLRCKTKEGEIDALKN